MTTPATKQLTYSFRQSGCHDQMLCKWPSSCTNIIHTWKSKKKFVINANFLEAAKSKLAFPSTPQTMNLMQDPARLDERIAWEQNSASLPKLTNPVSLFTLVLHKIQLRGGWWAFALEVLTQLKLLSPQPLLSAKDGTLEYQK